MDIVIPEIVTGMRTIGVGIDIVENDRVHAMAEKFGDKFHDRFFTEAERDYCLSKPEPVPSFAARLAAKEAMYKAISGVKGMGLRWNECEVLVDDDGVPYINLYGSARAIADKLGCSKILVSLTHEKSMSAAVVITLAN